MPVGDLVYLFGQVRSQGRAMTQDLNQFASRGIPIYDELAKVMGVSTAQIKEFASQGKIGFNEIDQVFKNMTENGGKFAGLMDAQSQTLAGRWSNFNDQLDRTAVALGKEMAGPASDLITIFSALLDKMGAMNNGPDSITMTGSIIKDVANMLNGTADTVETIGELMGEVKVDEILNEVRMWEATSTGISAKVEDMKKKYGDVNAAAAIYSEYVKGHVKLTDEQVANLETIIRQHTTMLSQANGLTSAYSRMAEAFKKAGGKIPTEGGVTPKVTVDTKKSEAQIFQDNLNLMQDMELVHYEERQKMAEDFFKKKMDLEKVDGENLAEWQAVQTELIASNTKLNFDQKMQAMEALQKVSKEKSDALTKGYAKGASLMLSTTGDLFSAVSQIMENTGHKSRALIITMRALAAAQAIINAYLAASEVRKNPYLTLLYPANEIAAGLTLATGFAQAAAIATTPLPSAQTGLSSYEVPDIRQNRNDGAAVRAQAGETVTVTPRGETSNSGVTNVSIKIGEAELFNVVQRGINTGEIVVNNNNIGRGVFAV
jgi:tape measure domain-containing protein